MNNPENTLHWHALNYRTASTKDAHIFWLELEKFVYGRRCKNCKHYVPADSPPLIKRLEFSGECHMHNKFNGANCPIDGVAAWDYEDFSCGLYVGPDFGCIKWEGKE